MKPKLTRPDGKSITYDYNQLDALLTADYSDEVDGEALYTYDQEGKRLSMSDLTGTSAYEYDADGRITGVHVQQGDGSVILYAYDSFGNLTKLTYPDGSEVTYEYDALDWLVKVTDRKGKNTAYTHDTSGNMTGVDRANGTKTELTYDAVHQATITGCSLQTAPRTPRSTSSSHEKKHPPRPQHKGKKVLYSGMASGRTSYRA